MQCGGKICQYVVEHVACSCCPSLVYMVWLESVYSLKTVITLSAPCALTTMLHLQSWLYPGFHKLSIVVHAFVNALNWYVSMMFRKDPGFASASVTPGSLQTLCHFGNFALKSNMLLEAPCSSVFVGCRFVLVQPVMRR